MINNFLTSLLGLNIYVYGLGVTLSLITFIFLYWRSLRKTALNEEKLVDALFAASFLALVSGRLVYVLLYWAEFKSSILKPFLILNYPGVHELFFWLAFFAYFWFYGHNKKIAFTNLIKLLFAPIVVTRLLLAVTVAVKTMNLATLLLPGLLLFLVGLYQLLTRVFKKESLKKEPFLMLIGYLIIPNFVVDFFKQGRVYFGELTVISLEQWLILGVGLLSLLLFIIKLIKNRKK